MVTDKEQDSNAVFYPKKGEQSLQEELFLNPTNEYRAAPFWAWNGKLQQKDLLEQVDVLHDMGFGGMHIHPRQGLEDEYLGQTYMGMISECIKKASDCNMYVYLYDEDRWPSGFAGGLVTEKTEYRENFIVFTKNKRKNAEKSALLACYDIKLTEKGYLQGYKRIAENQEAQNCKWYAYLMQDEPSTWYNHKTYVDTLNSKATQCFIDCTHEAYKKEFGEYFGKSVPSIFTDEPHYSFMNFLSDANKDESVRIPWTAVLEKRFFEKYGFQILDRLPEVFWNQNNQDTSVRYQFINIVCELFQQSFVKPIATWCMNHGIGFLGHLLEEDKLSFQTHAIGEAMRMYPYFSLPGIDMLFNGVGLNTVKQAQSVAHQYGKEGVMSELYGATGWNFDFRGHKFQGDWQAALGVTLRVPHHSWVSMGGNAKRDYPASINYQSPWYKEYPLIENHYARLNTALTRGTPIVQIGVIHPIESMWCLWGSHDVNWAAKEKLEKQHEKLTEWLLFGQCDFDFISEELLMQDGNVAPDGLKMNQMVYPVIIVPECLTLRKSTVDLLTRFCDQGGHLIFMGNCPPKIDAVPNGELSTLYDAAVSIPFEKEALTSELERYKLMRIEYPADEKEPHMISTVRKDGDAYWVFLANAKKAKTDENIVEPEHLEIVFKGEYVPVLYDTLNGKIEPCDYKVAEGATRIALDYYPCKSFLLKLLPKEMPEKSAVQKITEKGKRLPVLVNDTVEYSLEEDNVFVIDMAEYSVGESELKPKEEFRRIDREVRKILSLPDLGQPWIEKDDGTYNLVTVQFDVKSQMACGGAHLCGENIQSLCLNGKEVKLQENGYFVDKAIPKYVLPDLQKGENHFRITVRYTNRTSLENMYITGKFGVRVNGTEAVLVPLPEKLKFGSIVEQGFPFYGGNLTYRIPIEMQNAGNLYVHLAKYKGALARAFLDGRENGAIAFSPYEVRFEQVSPGPHVVEFKIFGTRINTFGPLHLCDKTFFNFGPKAWITEGGQWSYEYNLQPMGILEKPKLQEGSEESGMFESIGV